MNDSVLGILELVVLCIAFVGIIWWRFRPSPSAARSKARRPHSHRN